MKRQFLFLLILTVITISCENHEVQFEERIVKIRIQNSTLYKLENIEVNTSGGANTYSNLAAGQTSGYKDYEYAYRYASIKFNIGTKNLTFQPYDYVGETLYEEGLFAYNIKIIDFDNGQFSIDLIQD